MDTRAEYVEKLSAEMVEWDRQIDLLRDKAEGATPEEQRESSHAIAELQFKRDEAAQRLQGIAAAGDDEWEELAKGTERVWGEVRTILYDAIVKIS